jgi:hypothetical protein
MINTADGSDQPRVIGLRMDFEFFHERNDGARDLKAQVVEPDAA